MCSPTTLLNTGVTGPKFIKFTEKDSQIIAGELFNIRVAILQSVSEFQGYE